MVHTHFFTSYVLRDKIYCSNEVLFRLKCIVTYLGNLRPFLLDHFDFFFCSGLKQNGSLILLFVIYKI